MGTLFVDKLDPQSGTALEIGSSGDTITIPSGCTITNNGTQTGFGGANTPYFFFFFSSTQSISSNTVTKVQFNSEIFDSGNYFDNSTNYRWTPTAGTYFVFAQTRIQVHSSFSHIACQIHKNGSSVASANNDNNYYHAVSTQAIVSMNGTDYLEAYAVQNSGSSQSISGVSNEVFFGGYKIIT